MGNGITYESMNQCMNASNVSISIQFRCHSKKGISKVTWNDQQFKQAKKQQQIQKYYPIHHRIHILLQGNTKTETKEQPNLLQMHRCTTSRTRHLALYMASTQWIAAGTEEYHAK